MFSLDDDQTKAYRAELLAGEDRDLITDVGYFMLWYSTAELGFTNLLALAAGMPRLDLFDTLCSGMDFRVKIHRFQRIRQKNGGVGPNLQMRLDYLDQKCRPIRNRLAHSAVSRSEDGPLRYFVSSIATMPWREWGEPLLGGEHYDPPVTYTPNQLIGWGAWLAAFASDISQAFRLAMETGEFEITAPRSPEPPESLETRKRKARPAKGDKQPKVFPKA